MKKVFITLLCLSISTVALKAQDKKTSASSSSSGSAAVNPATVPVAAVPQSAPTTPPVDPNAGKFKFEEETHDFGSVPEGPLAEYDFVFKNVGKKPITIS